MHNLSAHRVLRPAVRYILQRMALFLVFAILLFVAAGKLAWFRGWGYVLYALLIEAGTLLVLARRAPGTLHHRGTWQAGVKTYDKLFAVAWVILSVLATPLVAGMDDRARSSSAPMAALYVGLVLFTLGSLFGAWAMVENVYLSSLCAFRRNAPIMS